jgi:hypothetical protein
MYGRRHDFDSTNVRKTLNLTRMFPLRMAAQRFSVGMTAS